jgi:hypothetical protein
VTDLKGKMEALLHMGEVSIALRDVQPDAVAPFMFQDQAMLAQEFLAAVARVPAEDVPISLCEQMVRLRNLYPATFHRLVTGVFIYTPSNAQELPDG